MKRVKLGNTGLEVSQLCFGGLVIGPLQVNLPVEKGADVIAHALGLGVNFIDTAELYGTYPHIRQAIRKTGYKPVVASKSYAYNREDARKSVEKARREMDLDVVDIFLMHEQESRLTLRGHREALEYYLDAKQKGILRAVGVSTHNIEVVEACADMPEIDVIHPLINKAGIGIGDGPVEDMLRAVKHAFDNGKGIYSMKPLGGGNLLTDYESALKYMLDIPYIHSIALGMQTAEEVEMNVRMFEGREIPLKIREKVQAMDRQLHIDEWCEGCGYCVERCKQKALSVVNGKAVVQKDHCALCGYCSSACSQFAIKIC